MERGPVIEKPDIREKGRSTQGQPLFSDNRLFFQLLAFGDVADVRELSASLSDSTLGHVLYEDLNDPRGVALLSFSRDPNAFIDTLRPLLNRGPFAKLTQKPQFTMFGRTYSLGYEPDLEETLEGRPVRTALNEAWPWAVWYPLRRSGRFIKLPAEDQRRILMEHGVIGRAFGEADFAHDIRLACHGLDTNDNDFVVGLMGRELYPLSAIVQTMRKTEQTSQYLEKLGPFFVGRALWRKQPV
jgi:chlorite dismutase